MTIVRAVHFFVFGVISVAFLTVAAGQDAAHQVSSVIYGPTPPELSPSAPGQNYALSGLDNVNLFNGHLNLAIPLHTIGGRGEAGYTMTIAVSNPAWAIENEGSLANQQWTFLSSPTAKWWHPYTAYQIGYTPGFVILKRSFQNLGTCSNDNTVHYKTTMTHVVFLAPDGAEIPMYSVTNSGPVIDSCPTAPNPPTDYSRGTVFQSRDASAMWFQYDGHAAWCTDTVLTSPGTVNQVVDLRTVDLDYGDVASNSICGTLYLRNGVQYQIDRGRVVKIIDRNGNYTLLAYCGATAQSACAGNDMQVESITDTLGRVTTINYSGCAAQSGQLCHSITYPGYINTPRTITVLWGQPQSKLRPDLSAAAVFPDLATAALYQQSPYSAYSVTLPNNQGYSFFFNSYGEVARMVLPTGGAVDYEYGAGLSSTGQGIYASGQVLDSASYLTGGTSSTPPISPFIYRRLTKRRQYVTVPPQNTQTSALDGLASSITSYVTTETATLPSYYPNTNPLKVSSFQTYSAGPISVTTTGDGGVNIQQLHTFGSVYDAGGTASNRFGIRTSANGVGLGLSVGPGGLGIPDPLDGVEVKTEIPGIETVRRIYTYSLSEGISHLCQEQTTLSSAVSQKIYLYGPYSNITDVYEFGYGQGPQFDYDVNSSGHATCSTSTSGFTRRTHTDYAAGNYTSGSVFLPGLATAIQIYDTGASVAAVQSAFNYDCAGSQTDCSVTKTGSFTNHDDAGHGTNFTTRGNLTRTS